MAEFGVSASGGLETVGDNCIPALKQSLVDGGDCFRAMANEVARRWEMGREEPSSAWSH